MTVVPNLRSRNLNAHMPIRPGLPVILQRLKFMRSFLSRFRGPLLLFAGIAVLTTVGLLTDESRPRNIDTMQGEIAPRKSFPTPTYPGVRQPPIVSAAVAALEDGEEVIGVVWRGKPRAYVIQSMRGKPQNHVINDLLGGAPITVTFCDLDRCVRVFTDSGSESLDVNIGGFRDGIMMLKVGSQLYSQKTGESLDSENASSFPYGAVSFEWTTWKKWREAHPETDVCTLSPATSIEADRSAGKP